MGTQCLAGETWGLSRPGGGGDPHPTHSCLFFLSGLAQLFREVRIMKGLNHPNIGEERMELAVGGAPGKGGWGCFREKWLLWCSHSCMAEVPWASALFSRARICIRVVVTG